MQVLSPGASYLALKAMMIPGRSEEEAFWRAFAGSRPVAWKTGTSFGFRDAWTIAVRPRWVVAVWAGDAAGGGHPGLWGSTAAAPLAFRIQPVLPHRGAPSWFAPPLGMVSVPTCPTTGFRRSPACPAGGTVLAPPAGRMAPMDPWHHLRPFDASGTWRVRSTCEDPHKTVQRPVLELPPAVEALMREAAPQRLASTPPWRAGCDPSDLGGDIQIVVPENGDRVLLPRDIDGSVQKLAIQVGHRRRDASVRCYLDDEDLGVSVRFRDFLVQPRPGPHRVVCLDDEGSRAEVRFDVAWTEKALRPR
jgi:penicillin-binding protein 1C